jgi:hypothetical protein
MASLLNDCKSIESLDFSSQQALPQPPQIDPGGCRFGFDLSPAPNYWFFSQNQELSS